jgi:molecular chaperone GrpE
MPHSKDHKDPKDKQIPPEENSPAPAEGRAPAEDRTPAEGQGAGNGAAPAPESNAAPEAAQEPLIGLSMTEYSELQNRIEQAEKNSKDYFDGWQRERADFNNFRKRIERDNVQMQQNLSGQVIKKYLVVVDDLARALKARPTQGEGAAWADGIELIFRKLNLILDAEGVTPIPADGAMFDPTFHEAISHEDSPDHQSGQIIEVVQQGYTIGEKVLRPALVRVAR